MTSKKQVTVSLDKIVRVLRERGDHARPLLGFKSLHSFPEICARVDGVKIRTVSSGCWTLTTVYAVKTLS